MVEPGAKVCDEVIEPIKFLLDHIDQLGEVLPLHLAALMMEIEPHVLDELVLHLVDDVRKSRSNTQLRPLLIDQVDEHLLTISLLDLLYVFLCELK